MMSRAAGSDRRKHFMQTTTSDFQSRGKWPRWLWRIVRLLWRAPLAHREAVRLARVMWRRSYRDVAPHWQPFDDTAGVISQIDNMHAGVVEENERMRAALLTIATTELSGDMGSDLGCIRAIARMALSSPNSKDQPTAAAPDGKHST